MNDQIFRSGFNLGIPEAEELDREIQRLRLRRDQLIADRLLGIERVNVGGVEMVLDPSMPKDRIELRDGRRVVAVVNLG